MGIKLTVAPLAREEYGNPSHHVPLHGLQPRRGSLRVLAHVPHGHVVSMQIPPVERQALRLQQPRIHLRLCGHQVTPEHSYIRRMWWWFVVVVVMVAVAAAAAAAAVVVVLKDNIKR